MAIEKAKLDEEKEVVSEEVKAEQLRALKSNSVSLKDASTILMRELALLEKKLEVMQKYPKVLKPKFEFESTDEYTELSKEEWAIGYEKQRYEIESKVEGFDNRLTKVLEEIEKLKGEQDE